MTEQATPSNLVAKQAFLAARTCVTQGWHVHHAEAEVPGFGLKWRFWTGQDVGRRARDWLGDGLMLRRTPVDLAAADTRTAIDAGEPLIFEATFVWNGLVARADALRRTGDGWDLIEIKSGKSKDETLNDEYLDDIAYTRCVAEAAGLTIRNAELVLINGDYTLGGAADMFTAVDVSADSAARAASFRADAGAIAAGVAGDARPEPEYRFECKDCDFFRTDCVGVGVPDPLFMLPRLSRKRFEAMKEYRRVSHLPPDAELTEAQQRVADVIRSGVPHLRHDGLEVLDRIVWPARYLDFETVNPHLPWFEGKGPYAMEPFQYSIHVLDAPDAEPRHHEYLASHDGDWRRELVEQMLTHLGTSGSIIVYSSFEKGRIKALAADCPDLERELSALLPRLVDLEEAFKKGYVHPGFGGRTSIKKVLPVMVDDVGYKGLPVNNGDDALGLFALMRVGEIDPDEYARHRKNLLAYCQLDTWAMVRLHAALIALRG